MESLEMFYQSDLLPDLEKLEARRLTVKKKFIKAVFIAVGFNLIFLFVAGKFGLHLVFILMGFALAAIFTLFPWYINHFRNYKEGFKDTIIPKIVAFIDQRLSYDKAGMVEKEEFMTSHLSNDKPGVYHGDDLVAGTLGQTAIRFSEIHAKRVDIIRRRSSSASQKTKKKYTPIFNGLFFVADFNKSFKGTTIVLPDTAQKLFGELGQALQAMNVKNGQLIKLEDPDFEKLFVVYGQDQIEARYILSTSLMSRLVEFQNRTLKKMRISFSASKLYIAIPFEKELFEPKIMESLLNISHVQEYYDDMKLLIDIVEELNLNTRIWTQKKQTDLDTVATANASSETHSQNSKSSIPAQGNQERLSGEETQAAFNDFINKADSAMAPKVKTAKRWLKRIAAVFFLFLCLLFFIFESYMIGFIILGVGLFFLAGGFMNPGVEKLAGSVLLISIGIGIALSNYSAYKTSVESENWPIADGMIIKSEIEREALDTKENNETTTEVKLFPKIVYKYQVNGKKYEYTKVFFSPSPGPANQIVSRYPKGKIVQVYYNPGKPNQAVLVPGNASFNYVPFFFAGVLIFLGVAIVTKLRKKSLALGNQI
jgi:hypothetical protein